MCTPRKMIYLFKCVCYVLSAGCVVHTTGCTFPGITRVKSCNKNHSYAITYHVVVYEVPVYAFITYNP